MRTRVRAATIAWTLGVLVAWNGAASGAASASVYGAATAVDVPNRDVTYDYARDGDLDTIDALVRADSTNYATFAYDDLGNLVTKTTVEGTWTFRYGSRGNLKKVVAPDGHAEIYYYAGPGSRLMALSLSSAGAPEGLRLWAGEAEVEYDATGTRDRTFLNVSLDSPVARIGDLEDGYPPNDVEYTYHDGFKSLLATTDGAGTILAGFMYDPFGQRLTEVGTPDDDLRLFNGKERDEISGLSYYGYRYYDPLTISWTQADPLYRFAPDLAYDRPRETNLYTFSLNNPFRYYDPDGLDHKRTWWEWVEAHLKRKLCNLEPICRTQALMDLAKRARKLGEEDGWTGYVNAFNPFYDAFIQGHTGNVAWEQGDYAEALRYWLDAAESTGNGVLLAASLGEGFKLSFRAIAKRAPFRVRLNSFEHERGGPGAARLKTRKRIPGLSGKEAAKNVPSWARGEAPFIGENGRDFAHRLLDREYGRGNYKIGPGTEFSKIKKFGDRAFEKR